MEEQRDYSKLLDLEPPADAVDILRKRGAFKKQYLIYRAAYYTDPLTGIKEKGVKVTCSACGESFLAEYIKTNCCNPQYAPAPFGFQHPETGEAIFANQNSLCPCCGTETTAAHIGQMPRGINQDVWCMSFGRIEDKLVAYCWYINRNIDKEAESHYKSWPYEAYVFEKKKTVRLMGYQKVCTAITLYGHWEQRKTALDCFGEVGCDHILPYSFNSIKGTTCENSKLDMYLNENVTAYPISYLRAWQKHPQLENLITSGFAKLVNEMINDDCKRYGYPPSKGVPKMASINWKEKRPAAMLGLTKEEFNILRGMDVKELELHAYKELRDMEPVKLPEALELIRANKPSETLQIMHTAMRGNVSVLRVLRYMENQKRRGNIRKSETTGFLYDYWRMAAQTGRNLNDISVLLPKNLKFSHDSVDAEIKTADAIKKAKEREKEINARAEKFAERAEELQKYVWERDGILIRPAVDEKELIAEGELLHHCVARYAAQICSGSTAIFFIRRAEEPDKPWYTLELEEKGLTVRQNRGSHNCDRTPEIEEFEAAWIEHLKEMRTKKTKKGEYAA